MENWFEIKELDKYSILKFVKKHYRLLGDFLPNKKNNKSGDINKNHGYSLKGITKKFLIKI